MGSMGCEKTMRKRLSRSKELIGSSISTKCYLFFVTNIIVVVAVLFLHFVGSTVCAREVSFSWLPNVEIVEGYELYVWKDTVPITQDNASVISESFTLRLGNTTSYVLKDLLDESTYYFAIKAYKTGELDSPFSDILRLDAIGPPVADFMLFQLDKTLTVTFDAISSRRDLNSYSWNFGDGSTASAANVSHTYVQGGTYNISLTVRNSRNQLSSSINTIELSVLEGMNVYPRAIVSSTDTHGKAPLTIKFDGTGSIDPDGDKVNYSWSFGDGSKNSGGGVVMHTYDSPGTYSCVLTVMDNMGRTSNRVIPVNVLVSSGGNVAESLPVPSFAVKKHNSTSNKNSFKVSFDASMSKPSQNASSIREYTWNLGDGSVARGRKFSHYYPSKQRYTVTLTVTDSNNKKASTSSLVDWNRIDPPSSIKYLPFLQLLLQEK
jgi:PKD repeat protein